MNWKFLPAFALAAAGVASAADAIDRLPIAATVFKEIMATSDKAIPQDLLAKSQCVVVVPGLKKGAFIVGGKFGRGFVECRKGSGVGWSAPGSVRVEGGSFGFQIGGAEVDVIMLIMNQRGVERLFGSKFTLGGDASVAAGPVGRTASAETDAAMTAEILTWSRTRGLFAGVSLNGATLRADEDWNRELYGRKIMLKEILAGDLKVPDAARPLLEELNRYSSRK